MSRVLYLTFGNGQFVLINFGLGKTDCDGDLVRSISGSRQYRLPGLDIVIER
jgi:hypothetical protein